MHVRSMLVPILRVYAAPNWPPNELTDAMRLSSVTHRAAVHISYPSDLLSIDTTLALTGSSSVQNDAWTSSDKPAATSHTWHLRVYSTDLRAILVATSSADFVWYVRTLRDPTVHFDSDTPSIAFPLTSQSASTSTGCNADPLPASNTSLTAVAPSPATLNLPRETGKTLNE